VVGIWTPGNQPMQTRPTSPVPIVADAKIVMQIHYHPAGVINDPESPRSTSGYRDGPQEDLLVAAFRQRIARPPTSFPTRRRRRTAVRRAPQRGRPRRAHAAHRPTSARSPDVRHLFGQRAHHLVGTHIAAGSTAPPPAAAIPDRVPANGRLELRLAAPYIYDRSPR